MDEIIDYNKLTFSEFWDEPTTEVYELDGVRSKVIEYVDDLLFEIVSEARRKYPNMDKEEAIETIEQDEDEVDKLIVPYADASVVLGFFEEMLEDLVIAEEDNTLEEIKDDVLERYSSDIINTEYFTNTFAAIVEKTPSLLDKANMIDDESVSERINPRTLGFLKAVKRSQEKVKVK